MKTASPEAVRSTLLQAIQIEARNGGVELGEFEEEHVRRLEEKVDANAGSSQHARRRS